MIHHLRAPGRIPLVALEELGRRRDSSSSWALLETLTVGDTRLRRRALEVAASQMVVARESWLRPLEDLLDVGDERDRERVYLCLKGMAGQAVQVLLLSALEREPEGEWKASLEEKILQPLAGDGSFEALLEDLGSGCRARATMACRRLGEQAVDPERGAELFEAASLLDRPTLAGLLPSLAEVPRKQFRRDVLSGDPLRVRGAILGLAVCGEEQDLHRLRLLAVSEQPAWASLAWDGLGGLLARLEELPDQLAGQLLEGARRGAGAWDVELRRAVARAAVWIPGGVELLQALVEDPDPFVRGTALRIQFQLHWPS